MTIELSKLSFAGSDGPPRDVTSWMISAPSRLHLGLLPRLSSGRFGGAGIMLQEPRTRIRVTPRAGRLQISGPAARRAEEFANHWKRWSASQKPRRAMEGAESVHVEILASPPEHVGLGSGTQLALALATALEWSGVNSSTENSDRPWDLDAFRPQLLEWASFMGRAGRSSVGTLGFLAGGMAVDLGGTAPGEGLSRCPFPQNWPILLLTVPTGQGLSGSSELDAFSQILSDRNKTRQEMLHVLLQSIVPAVQQLEFDEFAEAVYEFGTLSGSIFSDIQKGVFCSPLVARVVDELRTLGIRGVVQSSWGPTLGVFFPDFQAAERALPGIRNRVPSGTSLVLTRADNQGACRENS